MIIQKELIKSLQINGDKTAIECDGQSISYAELYGLANKVTRFLTQQKLEKETVVGVQLSDRPALISAMIGILNARCVFVPIDPLLPPHRFRTIVQELNLRYLITSVGAVTKLPDGEADAPERFYVEDVFAGPDAAAAGIESPGYEADDSVYIYFTSGTTGTPKGIVGKNCSLMHFLQWEIETFAINGPNRFSQLISPYFDAFLRDVFVPLLTGGTICIPPGQEDFLSPEKLTAWIDETGVHLIHCVPSLFRVFNNGLLTPQHYKDLKYVLLSGERIIPAELANWYQVFDTRIQLVNLYGPTEATMTKSCYRISPSDVTAIRIPIGKPISNTEFFIANEELKPCNTLVAGDLYIVSDYLTKGYLNSPGLTQEKFIRLNTGAGQPAAVNAYKTGDKARRLINGMFDLLGREDRQVKLRGIRVELDEIEAVLVQAAFVKNAVVVKHTYENGDEALIAFIIGSGTLPVAGTLRDAARLHLQSHLPAYLVPAEIFEVGEYPLMSNGKIDYKALLRYTTQHEVVAPANPVEAKLLTIWQEILGDKPISVEESFQKQGGTSLSVMRLLGRIYKEFNVKVSLVELFTSPTIRKQAELIKRAKKDGLLVVSKAAAKPAYHTSAAQQRIYYQYETNKESTAYNLPMVLQIKGAYDQDKIEATLQSLIRRHESLRTEFAFEEGTVLQSVQSSVPFRVEAGESEGENIQAVVGDFVRPFDLGSAPLFRGKVVSTPAQQHFLLIDTHHIVCDGISQVKLAAEFLKIYNGQAPDPLRVQYKDYAEWEHNYRATGEYMLHREFWLKQFEGKVPKLDLPTRYAGSDATTDAGGEVAFEIEKQTLGPLLRVLQEEEVATSSLLYSFFLLYLSQLTGQDDLVLGMTTSGRMQQETEEVVGMFAKTLPVRHRIDVNLSFRQLLKAVHARLIEARSNQVYDLSDIVSEINNSRSVHVAALFDAVFVFLNFENQDALPGAGTFSTVPYQVGATKYPLLLFASETPGSFRFRLQYSSLYFTRPDAELLVTHFKSLVRKSAENAETILLNWMDEEFDNCPSGEDDIVFNL
jgi:amino acid adenylation domain-containing protein